MVMIIVPNSVIHSGSIPVDVENHISPQVWNLVITSLLKADNDSNLWACLIEGSVCLCLGFPCIFCCHGCISGAFSEKRRLEKLNNINRTFFYGRPVFSTTDQFGIVINTDFIIDGAQIHQASAFTPSFSSSSSSHIQYAQLNMNDYDTINPIVPTQTTSTTSIPAYAEYPAVSNSNDINEIPVAVSVPINSSSSTNFQKSERANSSNNNRNNNHHINTTGSHIDSSDNTQRIMEVIIPEGAMEGTLLTVAAPGNTIVQVTVPPNITPGQSMQVRY